MYMPKHKVHPVTMVAQINPKPGHIAAKGKPAVATTANIIDALANCGKLSFSLSKLLKNRMLVNGIKTNPSQWKWAL